MIRVHQLDPYLVRARRHPCQVNRVDITRVRPPYIEIANEPPPNLIVDPPLPDLLDRGVVWIQWRAENVHIAPVFGKGALNVSPRLGHLHIHVDDVPWERDFIDVRWEHARQTWIGEVKVTRYLTAARHFGRHWGSCWFTARPIHRAATDGLALGSKPW